MPEIQIADAKIAVGIVFRSKIIATWNAEMQ